MAIDTQVRASFKAFLGVVLLVDLLNTLHAIIIRSILPTLKHFQLSNFRQIFNNWLISPTCCPSTGMIDLRMSAAFSPDSIFLTMVCNKLRKELSGLEELARPANFFGH